MKEEKTRIILTASCLYFLTERRLQAQSRQGWNLVSYHGVKYRFRRGVPSERRYFIYHAGGVLRDDGKYSLTLRHWNIPETYGVSSGRSELNDFTRKTDSYIRIIEVDPEADGGEAFTELVNDRRTLYFKEFLKKCGLLFLAAVILSVVLRGVVIRTVFAAISGIMLIMILLGAILHVRENRLD